MEKNAEATTHTASDTKKCMPENEEEELKKQSDRANRMLRIHKKRKMVIERNKT